MLKVLEGELFKKRKTDAGYDVVSDQDIVIYPRQSELISTGLRIELPANHVGILKSRSGLSTKYQLEVGAGVLDEGYTGEVKVHLYNLSDIHYQVKAGDRIAQLLVLPVNTDFVCGDGSERGSDGFGSTGI